VLLFTGQPAPGGEPGIENGAGLGVDRDLSVALAHVLGGAVDRSATNNADRLAGHSRLETTRRYSLLSDADRQAAMDSLVVDY